MYHGFSSSVAAENEFVWRIASYDKFVPFLSSHSMRITFINIMLPFPAYFLRFLVKSFTVDFISSDLSLNYLNCLCRSLFVVLYRVQFSIASTLVRFKCCVLLFFTIFVFLLVNFLTYNCNLQLTSYSKNFDLNTDFTSFRFASWKCVIYRVRQVFLAFISGVWNIGFLTIHTFDFVLFFFLLLFTWHESETPNH